MKQVRLTAMADNNCNNAIDYFQYNNPLTRLKSIIAFRARKKMFARFMELTKPCSESLVLDVGVTPDCSLPETNYFEKMYPYTANITMTSIEDASMLESVFPGARFVQTQMGGGCVSF